MDPCPRGPNAVPTITMEDSAVDRDLAIEGAVNATPLAIIVLLTLLFVAYNPWGWHDLLIVGLVGGLHAIPILTLAPVTYLVVRVVREAEDGRSQTAARARSRLEPPTPESTDGTLEGGVDEDP